MAKRPVQKYKRNKSATRTRYSANARKAIKKLEGIAKANKHTLKKANVALKGKKQEKVLEKIKKVKA
jgi:hypothetical protein